MWYNISTYKGLIILRVLRGEMNMKKKQILASLVMLSLLQGNAYAAFDYVVTEDTEWPDVVAQQYGKPQGNSVLNAGNTLTIKNNAIVHLDYQNAIASDGTDCIYDIPFIYGGVGTGDITVTGGNLEIIGPAEQANYTIWNTSSNPTNIKLDGTNTYFKDFQYGIRAQGGTTEILNNEYAKFENINYGIYAVNKDTSVKLTGKEITFNNGMEAIHTYFKSNVTIDNIDKDGSKVEIIDHYRGIGAENQSEININTNYFKFGTTTPADDKLIAITCDYSDVNITTKDIDIESDVAIYATNKSNVEINVTGGDSSISGDILALGDGKPYKNDPTVNVTVDSGLAGQGTLAAANDGTVNVVLNDGCNWAGRADDYMDAKNQNWDHTKIDDNPFFDEDGNSVPIYTSGTVNLTLNKAIWNVTGQSWITNLKGDDGLIILDGAGAGGHALHVGTLEGKNTFAMNIRPDESGDMLYVQNGTGDQQNIIINNPDEVLNTINVGEAVRFATVAAPGNGFENGEFVDRETQTFGKSTRIADAGMFNVNFDIKYNPYDEVMKGDLGTDDKYNGGANFEDSNAKPGSDYVDEIYGKDGAQNVYIVRKETKTEDISDAGKTIINMSKVNYNNAIYMDRLNKRLGEARYINPEEEKGMWVRIRHDRIGKDDAFRSQNTMYEMGYDEKQDCDNGERRVGFAIDYMDGKAEYSGIAGDGDVKRYGLWLYDTWMGDKGHYADYVAKWGHLENDFDIMARSTGEKINGDYSNNVFSVSAEYGKKNDMGNSWYFEPQAQLQLARVTGADYTTSQGTRVSLDGINSLIGRAGFRLGRDVDERSTVYVKADLLHEFLGEQDMHVVDNTFNGSQTFENKGTWYDVGFGFATALGKDSYAFMDFEKSFGNDNDETYQINAGVQWTF